MATATATSARRSGAGAGIIVWYKDQNEKYLLVGKESTHLTDLPFDPTTKKMIEIFEEYKDDNDLPKANIYFAERARAIEKDILADPAKRSIIESRAVMPIRIQYDIPTPREDSIGYSVKYRYLDKNFKRGIVKGGVEPIDKTREDTARREFHEEVGINLTGALLIPLTTTQGYEIFTHEIISTTNLKVKVDGIIKRISDRGRKGEVYELGFKPLSIILNEIRENPRAYNVKSREAIEVFANSEVRKPTQGGRRRSRKQTKGGRRKPKKNRRRSRKQTKCRTI